IQADGWTSSCSLLSLNRSGLGDQRPEQPGDTGCREGEHEEDHCGAADVTATNELDTVVGDGKGDRRREERREPGDVLLPLHREVVPIGRAWRGEQLRLRE